MSTLFPKSITSGLLLSWTCRLTSKASPQMPCPKILGAEKGGLFFTTKETVPRKYCPWLGDCLVCPALLRSQQQEIHKKMLLGQLWDQSTFAVYTTKTAGKGQIETVPFPPGAPSTVPAHLSHGLQPQPSAQIPFATSIKTARACSEGFRAPVTPAQGGEWNWDLFWKQAHAGSLQGLNLQLDVVSYSCASARRLPPRSRSERPPCQSMKDFPINSAVSRAASPAGQGSARRARAQPGQARTGGLGHFHPLQNANDFKGAVGRGPLTLGRGAPSASAFALPTTWPPKYISLPDAEHCKARNAVRGGPTLMSGSSEPTGERRRLWGWNRPPGVRNPLY